MGAASQYRMVKTTKQNEGMMKFGQWMVVIKHDEDPSLVGKLVIVCSPVWWRPKDSKDVDVQIDDCSTTFIHEDGLRPITMSKEVRKEMNALYDFSKDDYK